MSGCDLGRIVALLLAAAPALAQTPLTAEEFEAFSIGKTLDYATHGQLYGSEMHLPGRKTRDADTGEACHDGIWFPRGEAICFVYDGDPVQHCWTFWREDGEVMARPANSAPDAAPSVVTIAKTPLVCPGPEVGV